MPKVVETRTKHAGKRGERANVPAEITTIGRVQPVGLDHHRHGVPAHVGAQAFFNFQIARGTLFLVNFNGVDIAGIGRKRHVNTLLAGMLQQIFNQKVGALRAVACDDGAQRVHPFAGFLTVFIKRSVDACISGNCVFRLGVLGVGCHGCLLRYQRLVKGCGAKAQEIGSVHMRILFSGSHQCCNAKCATGGSFPQYLIYFK